MEKSAITFLSECERKFWDILKKTQISSEKVSWELRKLLSLLRKRMLEKREHFSGKKSAWMKLSDPSKNSDFLSERFFSNFFGRQFQFFGGIFEINFFVKNFFVFAPSNFSGTFEETFFAVMLKLHSRCPQRNSRSFLFRKQTRFQFFFGLWAKEFQFLKENFERYCQKTLLHY